MAKEQLNIEYSIRQLEKAKGDFEKLDTTPLFIPVGNQRPETFNEAIGRILYHSGALTRDAYDKLNGINYDPDTGEVFDDEYDDDEGDFEQSPFASYADIENNPSRSDQNLVAPQTSPQEPAIANHSQGEVSLSSSSPSEPGTPASAKAE